MEHTTEVMEPVADTDSAIDEAPADDPSVRLARIIESILFAAAAPVSLRRLVEILDGPTVKEALAAIAYLAREYAPGVRGIQLHEVAGGYQLRTARENAEWVRAVFRDKPTRLGRAALETLSVVAYKQPVTRAEIEAIRGVDVDGTLTTLLSRRLIKIAGRKEAVGRPLLYTTTAEFLEAFGLRDLNELPSLKELGPVPEGEDGEATVEAVCDTTAAAAGLGAEEDGASAATTAAAAGLRAEEDGASAATTAAVTGLGAEEDGARAATTAAATELGAEAEGPGTTTTAATAAPDPDATLAEDS